MLLKILVFYTILCSFLSEANSENFLLENQEILLGMMQTNRLVNSAPNFQTNPISERCKADKLVLIEMTKNNKISFQTLYDQCINLGIKNVSFPLKYCRPTINIRLPTNNGTHKKSYLYSPKIFANVFHKFENAESLNLVFALLLERRKFTNSNEPPLIENLPLPVCYPESCSSKDIENDLAGNFQIFSTENLLTINVKDSHCVTKAEQNHFRAIDWVFIGFLILLGILIVLSTGYDLYSTKISKVKPNRFLILCSWYTHLNNFVNISKFGNTFPALDGLRTLSICWIILAQHFKYFILTVPCINSQDFVNWTQSLWSQFIFGASFGVETLLFLSGFLVMHSYAKAQKSFNFSWFYVFRYLRFTPALVGIIFFVVTVFRYFGDGPLWTTMVEAKIEPCKQYWWSSLLYMQNLWNPKTMCIEESWYLQVYMQLNSMVTAILAAIVFMPKFAWRILFLLIGISSVAPVIAFWALDLRMDLTQYIPGYNFDIHKSYFYATWARALPWLLGIALGHYMFKCSQKTKLNQEFVNFMWIISAFGLPGLMVSKISFLQIDSSSDSLLSGFYCSYATFAWCMIIGWIVFACIRGYGNFINHILSFPIFQMISRLTYSMLLIHPIVLAVRFGSIHTIGYFQPQQIAYTFWGTLIYTIFFSMFWTLTFEMPMISLVKIIKSKKSNKNSEIETSKKESVVEPRTSKEGKQSLTKL